MSPKFFYDPLGSRLFDAITDLQEYYPTRTEAAIFEAHGSMPLRVLPSTRPAPRPGHGRPGCGQLRQGGAPVRPSLAPRARYVAVDISVDFLRDSLLHLQREHPAMQIWSASAWTSRPGCCCRTGASTARRGALPRIHIGNFAPEEALRLLRQARALVAGGALLIGVGPGQPAGRC